MNSEQGECMSIKFLLKQVYSAHTTKVKDLEREIKELKLRVQEKERKILEVESSCKKCIELEEAFKSCKAALCEQSKRFEDLGQKFSVFGDSEASEKHFDKTSDNLKESSIYSEVHGIEDINIPNSNNQDASGKSSLSKADEVCVKPSLSSIGKQNFLKNVLNDYDQSLDLCTVTFPQNLINDTSYLKLDSAILAPDSLDVATNGKSADVKDSVTDKHSVKVICSDTKVLKFPDKSNAENIQLNNKSNRAKCLNSVSNNRSVKRSNTESELDHLENKRAKSANSFSEKSEDLNHSKMIETQNEVISSAMKTNDKDLKTSSATLKKNIASVLDVVICKTDNKNTKTSGGNYDLLNTNNKENSYQTSPSLLPLKENVTLADIKTLSNDNEDFQSPTFITKASENEGTWERCDKRKLLKKTHIIKAVKSSSRFKMTLDAPLPNYKKPSYRQTTLSKSIFQIKNSKTTENKNSLESTGKENVSIDKQEKGNEFTLLFSDFQTSTPAIEKAGTSATDFDATCIPENFKYVISPCNNSESRTPTSDVLKTKSEDSVLLLDPNFSEEECAMSSELEKADQNELSSMLARDNKGNIQGNASSEAVCKELLNSFDRLPSPIEPNYKYKEETVRKKAERKLLDGFDCKECEKYYSVLGLSDKEKKERMKKCSRHRAKFALPPTPDHFWELEFPDTEECKARGYLNETQKRPLNPPNGRLPL